MTNCLTLEGMIIAMKSQETPTTLNIELEQEEDGRWIAEVLDLPGVLAYGASEQEAISNVQALALHVTAARLEHVVDVPTDGNFYFLPCTSQRLG